MTAARAGLAHCCDWPLLYSVGAHGIMTLNDFKSVEGDRRMGINSLPVLLGVESAARFACLVMAVPQAAGGRRCCCLWQRPFHAGAVGALLFAQLLPDGACS